MYNSKYGEHGSSIRSRSFRKTARRVRKTFASVWTRGIGYPLLFGIAFNGSYSDVDLWHSEISGVERCSTAARRYNVSDNGVLYDDLIYIGFFRAGSGISTIWRIEKSTRARQRETPTPSSIALCQTSLSGWLAIRRKQCIKRIPCRVPQTPGRTFYFMQPEGTF